MCFNFCIFVLKNINERCFKKSYKNVLYIKFIEGFNFFFVNLLFLK